MRGRLATYLEPVFNFGQDKSFNFGQDKSFNFAQDESFN